MMSRPTFPPLEDDFTRALLRSADGDEPSSAAYAKAATALGVGAGLGVGASLAAPSMVAAGAAGFARWSGSTAARLWALCVSGALLVSGGALLLNAGAPSGVGKNSARAGVTPGVALLAARPPEASLAPSVEAPPLPVGPQPVAELDADELAAEAATAQAAAVPGIASAASAAVPGGDPARAASLAAPSSPHVAGSVVRRAARSAPDSSSSSLAEQVQSLDRARVALGSADAGTALSEIEHYRKAWPRGVFLTEASVLEIEALAVRGQRSLAAARAAAFVAAHPDSPQAERLRRLIPAPKP